MKLLRCICSFSFSLGSFQLLLLKMCLAFTGEVLPLPSCPLASPSASCWDSTSESPESYLVSGWSSPHFQSDKQGK